MRYISVLCTLLVTASAWAQQPASPPRFQLMSSAFKEGETIPTQYTCAAGDFSSPPLAWSNAPQGTQSFAIIMHDTDAAPRKGVMDVTHWLVWGIPASVSQLDAGIQPNSMPHGILQGKNIRGANGYQGPCPPPGGTAHHYIFEIYALDQELDLPAGSSRDELRSAMDGHVIGKATYIGMFSRHM